MTSVLVTSVPMRPPPRPVRGICTPFSAGEFLTTSGVSPCGTCQAIVPLFRSIAVMRPYGGLMSGNPWTVMDGPPSPATAGEPPGAGGAGGGAFGSRARPWIYDMSDRDGSLTMPIADGFENE